MKKFLNIIHIIVLLCAYAPLLNQWITPKVSPYWTSFALAFPIVIGINLFLILLWALLSVKRSLIFTFLSIPLMILIKPWFPFWNNPSEQSADLSLMTYNVRYFYDDLEGIYNLFHAHQPDIVFLQEMGGGSDELMKRLGEPNPYFFENYNSLGIASIYPIVESSQIRYDNFPLTAVYGDIAMPHDTIRLINFYLESLHLDQEELKKPTINSTDVSEKSKMLITKVAHAAKVHQSQINLIQDIVRKSPHPVILGGDLNAVPTSFEYYKIKEGLIDAFTEVGTQPGNTFRSLKIPLKLDYVFSSEEIKPVSYDILKVNYSDHYPTFVRFQLPE
ncbi:hypothetical protein GO491_02700 [Flavobacteriaceae bacterium Ap0902]|nr:hypothetical protein [Flavobacteriaceae bacterium Ap0902]